MQTHYRRASISDRNSHPQSELRPRRSLENELGPAVLDACRSLWSEFVELASVDPESFSDNEHELLRWYAEVQFQLGSGGSRCAECRAHVRQAIPIRVEIADAVRDFRCLCTRCIVGFEHEADRMWYTVAGKLIEHPIRRASTYEKAA